MYAHQIGTSEQTRENRVASSRCNAMQCDAMHTASYLPAAGGGGGGGCSVRYPIWRERPPNLSHTMLCYPILSYAMLSYHMPSYAIISYPRHTYYKAHEHKLQQTNKPTDRQTDRDARSQKKRGEEFPRSIMRFHSISYPPTVRAAVQSYPSIHPHRQLVLEVYKNVQTHSHHHQPIIKPISSHLIRPSKSQVIHPSIHPFTTPPIHPLKHSNHTQKK